MKKTTIKLTSGILLSSLFLGNVSVVDIAKATEKEYTVESNSKNENISTKITKENDKNYLVVKAAKDLKNLNLNVKLADQVKKFKHNEIKAGETVKFELVLPKTDKTSANEKLNPTKTDSTVLSGTSLIRESLTTEVLVEGLKVVATVSYDVAAPVAAAQETRVYAPVAAPVVATSVAAPVTVKTTAAPTQYPAVVKTTTAAPKAAAPVVATKPVATQTNVEAAPVLTRVETKKAPQAATAAKPELKIISKDKAAAGLLETEKPVLELPTTVAPKVAAPVEAPQTEAATTAAPATTVAPKTEAAPTLVAKPAPVAAPQTEAAKPAPATTTAAPVTTVAPKTEAAPTLVAKPAVVTPKVEAPKVAAKVETPKVATPAVETKKEVAAPVKATKYMPVESADYTITSPYGVSRNIQGIGLRDVHNGVDIITKNPNESILATEAGTVMAAGVSPYGDGAQYVTIKHAPNSYTSYWHLANNSITVKAGQKVAAGQKIGTMGSTGWSTGVHLHFMHATSENIFSSHKDPMKYLQGAASKSGKTQKAATTKAANAPKGGVKPAAQKAAAKPAAKTAVKTPAKTTTKAPAKKVK